MSVRPALFADLPRPLLFAHRGASCMAPENTLMAFDLAARLGSHVLELDVHLSADDEVVVFHDATLERTTNGTGLVRNHTWAQLDALDAGCKFVGPNGAHLFAAHDVTIPRLDEVVRSFPRSAFNIELKQSSPQLVDKVIQIVAALPPQQVLLTAANHATMLLLEAAKPRCALGLSSLQAMRVVRCALWRDVSAEFSGRALQIPPRYRGLPLCLPPLLRRIKKAGIEVHVWTVDSPQQARKLLRRGVEGIMTNDPAALLPCFGAAATPPRS